MVKQYRNDMMGGMGFDKIYDDVREVVSMTARSQSYQNQLMRVHSDRGAFRSGEGTAD